MILALVGMFICECINGAVHLQFSHMRKSDGSQERPIPMVYHITSIAHFIGSFIQVCFMSKLLC